MNEVQQKKLEGILESGYRFDFGDYIGKGFDLLQRNMGNFVGFTLVFILISLVCNFIPILGPMANGLILTPAFTVGYYLVAHKVNREEPTQFNDFFKGFDYLGQLALAVVLQSLIMAAAFIPFFAATFSSIGFATLMDPVASPPDNFPFWTLILILPVIYLGVAYSWTYLFITFYKMDAWAAMEMSRKMITKQWFMLFLFSIVLGILVFAGIIALVIGIIFTIPIFYCAQYAAFADVTRLMEEAEDDIVDHLVTN